MVLRHIFYRSWCGRPAFGKHHLVSSYIMHLMINQPHHHCNQVRNTTIIADMLFNASLSISFWSGKLAKSSPKVVRMIQRFRKWSRALRPRSTTKWNDLPARALHRLPGALWEGCPGCRCLHGRHADRTPRRAVDCTDDPEHGPCVLGPPGS